MLQNIFNIIARKISYTFSVTLVSLIWSIIPAYYALYFGFATINLSAEMPAAMIIVLLTGYLFFTIVIHSIHFGVLHRFGFSGFSESIKTINTYMYKNHLFINFSSIPPYTLDRVYTYIVNLPKENLWASSIYALTMLAFTVIVYIVFTLKFYNLPYLLIGGLYASFVHGYFTFNLAEYFNGPTKEKLEDILFQKIKNFKSKYFLSFKYKSFFTLVLISLTMIILTIIIRRSVKPLWEIIIFILISIVTIGILIFLLISTISISLKRINQSTRDLASGGRGLFFSSFTDKELAIFSTNYNSAAIEIYKIRADLAKNVAERTEAIVIAYGKLTNAYSRIQNEMELAKKIQNSLLPRNLKHLKGIDLFVHYYPMSTIGGDIYDLFEYTPGNFRIFLADATGHGVQAALVTMIIKGEYEKIKKIDAQPSELLIILNNSFLDLYEFLNVFFTCIIIDLNITTKKMYFSSAGHPDQTFIHNGNVTFLPSSGKIIGVIKDTGYETKIFDIQDQDKLMLYTDGIFEQFNNEDEVYGEDRLKKMIIKNQYLPCPSLLNNIVEDLENFLGYKNKISKDDDITILGIQIGKV